MVLRPERNNKRERGRLVIARNWSAERCALFARLDETCFGAICLRFREIASFFCWESRAQFDCDRWYFVVTVIINKVRRAASGNEQEHQPKNEAAHELSGKEHTEFAMLHGCNETSVHLGLSYCEPALLNQN